jgi:hypothetical protein
MQRLAAVQVRDKKRVGNYSGISAGKTLSAVLASRVINAHLTVIPLLSLSELARYLNTFAKVGCSRFFYVPKHTSWLNQIGCWFSILVRRLLRRASFTSTTELSDHILEFIDYFNRTLSKPFQ